MRGREKERDIYIERGKGQRERYIYNIYREVKNREREKDAQRNQIQR